MEITKEYLLARQAELTKSIEVIKGNLEEINGNLNANYGALQQVNLLLEELDKAPAVPENKKK